MYKCFGNKTNLYLKKLSNDNLEENKFLEIRNACL